MVKWEIKIHDAVTPALVLLFASSLWIIMLLNLLIMVRALLRLLKEHNLCQAWANFPSQILMFVAQILFIPEVFLQ